MVVPTGNDLMWFKLLHTFPYWSSIRPRSLYAKLMHSEHGTFQGLRLLPWVFPSNTEQKHGVKAVVCLFEKLSVPEFQSILALKRVLGAGENELEPVQCLAFLSVAITEDPQRQRKSNEVRGPFWQFQTGLLCHTSMLAILSVFVADPPMLWLHLSSL